MKKLALSGLGGIATICLALAPNFIVAIGAMVLLLSATIVSWELLTKLAQERYVRKDD